MTISEFKKIVWSHHKRSGRDLPWRATTDPYKILVSEIMLQQTQVDRVRPKYLAWIRRWPSAKALAKAPLADVLSSWQGLGYNRRALALKRAAEMVVNKYGGIFPEKYEDILELPGVGPYSAGAIMAFAFNQPMPIIETNIRTVFLHHFFQNEHGDNLPGKIHDAALMPFIEKTLDLKRPREWYWALMDYGAYLKKTVGNASRRSAHHVRQSPFAGSRRQLRGAVLSAITASQKPVKAEILEKEIRQRGIPVPKKEFEKVLASLASEGFVKNGPRGLLIS